jgi:hypothetical protein
VFARASAFQQSRRDQLLLSPRRWHSFDKQLDVNGEVMVAVIGKVDGKIPPTALDLAPCAHKSSFTGLEVDVPFEQVRRRRPRPVRVRM